MNRIPVWFDTDIGIDDSIAFLVLNRLPQLKLLGISAVAGNVELGHTYQNARNICVLAGSEYPVYRGAEKPLFKSLHTAHDIHGPKGLGKAVLPVSEAPETDIPAWDAIYNAAVETNGELNVLTAGPLTNIAVALTKYPALSRLLKRILIMGGAVQGGNVTPAAEFNIFADPHAAQIVFKSGVPIVMFGLDVTEKAYITPEEVHELGKTDSAVCRFFRDSTEGILEFYLKGNKPGLCLHDVCPVMYLARPEMFSGSEAGVFVETKGTVTMGKTVCDLHSDKKFGVKNTFVVFDVDRTAFSKTVSDILKSY